MKPLCIVLLVLFALSGLLLSQTMDTPSSEGDGKPMPKIIKKVPPKYPEDAKKDKIQGVVILDVKIDQHGKVVDAKPIQTPHESLTRAAIEAVRQWEYEPSKQNGKPVSVTCTITMRFVLADDDEAAGKGETDQTKKEKTPKDNDQ